MSTPSPGTRQTPFKDIFAYATGDGASSLVMNSIFGFSMLYYTEALGLDYKLAGIAMAVATFWDAITDPLMGHVSDNTRSRFGRRHPYILFGGLAMVIFYCAIWWVPSEFRTPDLWIASAGEGTKLTLNNAETGQEIATFGEAGNAPTCIAVSPDGRLIASAYGDDTFTLREVETGKRIEGFAGHAGPVNALAFRSGGEQIVSASDDKTLRLWDTQTGKEMRSFTGHDGSVRSVMFSLDGEWIISGSDDKTLKRWEVQTGKEVTCLVGHDGSVLTVALSPNGQWVLSGSDDGALIVWEVENGDLLRRLEGHEGRVRAVAFSPNGQWIASGGDDKRLKLWQATTGEPLQTFDTDSVVSYITFSRDSRRMTSWGQGQALTQWDTSTWEPIRDLELPAAPAAIALHSKTKMGLFWYLVGINLLLRTAVTVFAVPYFALGFEVCTEYNQRTSLQGVRTGLNMAVNLLGPAMAWRIFFPERDDLVEPTQIASNFRNMGLVFAIAAMGFLLFVVYSTRHYAVDTSNNPEIKGSKLGHLVSNLKDVLFDPYPRTVFLFFGVSFFGIVLLTSLQMYIYVHFMKFGDWERAFVHGSTMVAAGLGGLLSAPMVRRFDKKPAIYFAVTWACVGNVLLVLIFATGAIKPGYALGIIPVATIVFMLFHNFYHLGCTMSATVAQSMMADVSEISRYRTGVLKDGSYSAMLTFVLKASISLGLLLCGYGLELAGFNVEAKQQTPEATRKLMLIAFLGGTFIAILAALIVTRYPVTRQYMDEIQASLGERSQKRVCDRCGCDLTGNTSGVCPECGRPIDQQPPSSTRSS